MIEARHISSGYGKKEVISDLSAVFLDGTITAVIGCNGSGKSTLVKTLLGHLPFSQGDILINDQPLKEMTSIQRARNMAYVPQSRNIPSISAFSFVLHGRFPYLSIPRKYTSADRKIALDALKQLHIEDLKQKNLEEISGGQRQKVYLAMALAQDTRNMILDEPSTYLDYPFQIEFMDLLSGLKKQGKCIVIILHDFVQALEYADQILVMHEGKEVFLGKPGDFIHDKKAQEALGLRIDTVEYKGKLRYFPEKIA